MHQISYAQYQGKLIGNVRDHTSALEFVTVTLSKLPDSSKVVAYTMSDSLGSFKFDPLEVGEYVLKMSLLGYNTGMMKVVLSKVQDNIQLSNLVLVENINQLQLVTITSTKKLIEKTTDGFIVNAAANITAIGGTATDLLKNTPTVSVDADGAITLRGKAPMILVNGRNSNLGNPDQIPASSIESIEIITNPSAKYDANAESGIINIKLKKNKQNGTNGAIAIGAGFGAKGRISNALILNNKTKKWNLGLGYDNRFAGRTRKINGTRTNFYLPENYLLTQDRRDHRSEQLQNLKVNLDFSPDEKNAFSLEAIGSLEGQDNFEDLRSDLRKQNNIFKSNTDRNSVEIARTKVAEFSLDYTRKYDDDRKSLTANISSSSDIDRENTDITSQALSEKSENIGTPFLERTHNFENGNVINAKVDYAFPISLHGLIETGYKATLRMIDADFLSATKVDDVYITNTSASNVFNFNENVHAISVSYQGALIVRDAPKWKYSIGLRAEEVNNHGIVQNSTLSIKNQYLKLFPNTSISYLFSPDEYLKLSYGKRINRPSLGLLNPFTDITDALNPHSGNPNLKPEIIHNVELGYSKEFNNTSFSINLFYRNAFNSIRPFFFLQSNGANLNMPINIGHAVTYGLENVLDLKVSNAYHFNASVSLFQQHLTGDVSSPDIVQDAFGWNGKLINDIFVSDAGKLQIVGNFNSALVTPQGRRLEQYFADLGYQHKLGKGNARLGLTIVDIFNTLKTGLENNTAEFSSYRTSKADTRAIMITFAYSFKAAFKEKLLDNQFSKE